MPALRRLCALLTLLSFAAAADTRREVSFDIRAQSLAKALIEFSRQADVQVLSHGVDLRRLAANELVGRYSIAQALTELLAETDLMYRETGPNTIAVTARGASANSISSALRVAEVALQPGDNSSSQRPAGAAVERVPLRFEEVVVTDKFFDYATIESANLMPMPVQYTPQSVKVLTEDMLDFAGIRTFNDLYKLDAGAHAANSGHRQIYHYSRGFSASPFGGASGIRVDGFRTATQFMIDLFAFERIELVKGATSTLYGQASLAGTMNAITKKPLAAQGGTARVEWGSYDWYRGEADFHGALSDDGRLSYRLIGTYTDSGGYIHGGFENSYMIAPTLQYAFTPDTTARLLVAYERSRTPANAGLGLVDGGDGAYRAPDIDPRQQVYPSWAHQTREAFLALATLEHRFGNDWQARAAATHYRTPSEMVSGYVGRTRPDGSSQFFGEWSHTTYLSQGVQVNLHGPFELFGRRQHVFVGVDYGQSGSQPSKYASARISDVMPFSIYGTDFDAFPRVTATDYLTGGRFAGLDSRYVENRATLNRQWGLTAQLQLQPTDRWSWTFGARRTQVRQDVAALACAGAEALENACGAAFFGSGVRPKAREDAAFAATATTVQVGTVYELADDVNVYASYGETFEPRGDRAFDPDNAGGRPLGPEEGEAYELGLKGGWFDAQLSWSVALFDITRNNVALGDRSHPDFSIDIGGQRSRGVEVDVQGTVLPGLGVYLSLAQLRNEFTAGDLRGIRTNLGPKFGASLFANYQIQSGRLLGLGVGAGVVYKDRVDAYDISLTSPPTLTPIAALSEDILQVDAHAYYNRDAWTYEVSARNIFDDAYWSMTRDFGLCCIFASSGPEVRFSASRRFGARDTR